MRATIFSRGSRNIYWNVLGRRGISLSLIHIWLEQYARCPTYPEAFGAKIYKIAWDPQGNRLTYLKVTGGSLKVRALLSNRRADLPEEKVWEEKVNQIRIYSGAKYQAVDEALAGAVCAVTGLSKTYPGEGLGMEASSEPPVPVSYTHLDVYKRQE